MKIFMALDELLYKYDRLTGLISIMQQYMSQCVDIAGAPEGAVENSLYEIELGMQEANKRLGEIIKLSKTNEARFGDAIAFDQERGRDL